MSAGAFKVNAVCEKIRPALNRLESEFPENSYVELWREATEPIKAELKDAGAELIPAIREDVAATIDPARPRDPSHFRAQRH